MRLRIRFSKHGKVRFTSHRDLARIWERAIRRTDLPVAYSLGFSPRPKVHFGLALPTGAESDCEFLDVDLVDGSGIDVGGLAERLDPALPVGIETTAVAEIPVGTMSLQEAVTSATWTIEVLGGQHDQLQASVDRLLETDQIVVTRQRKGRDVTDDIRPYLIAVDVALPTSSDAGLGLGLVAELGTRPRGLRPSELVTALGDPFREGRLCRTNQWMQHDGARQEPLPLSATSAPHATLRAS